MRFKLDENLPIELAHDVRATGHDCETVVDEGLTGAPDDMVLQRSRAEVRVLLTMDKGIADVRSYPPNHLEGIVRLRPASAGRMATRQFVARHPVCDESRRCWPTSRLDLARRHGSRQP